MEGLRGHTSRLRGADVRDRRARWRRQDPGHAQLPDQLLRSQGRAAQLRGLHHDLRGARDVPAARQGGLRVLPARAPGARPVRRPGPARGRADVDRAAGFEETHSRGNTEAHRLQDPSKWVPFGVGAIEGTAGAPLRCSRPGDDANRRPTEPRDRTTGPARSRDRARANRRPRPTGSCSRISSVFSDAATAARVRLRRTISGRSPRDGRSEAALDPRRSLGASITRPGIDRQALELEIVRSRRTLDRGHAWLAAIDEPFPRGPG